MKFHEISLREISHPDFTPRIIAGAPQVTIFVPFSGCLLYGDAKPIQADVGSDRGPAQGLFRWATVLVPSRVWSTASAARREHARPASDEFGRLGPDKGPSIVLGPCKGSWRDGGKSRRGCFTSYEVSVEIVCYFGAWWSVGACGCGKGCASSLRVGVWTEV